MDTTYALPKMEEQNQKPSGSTGDTNRDIRLSRSQPKIIQPTEDILNEVKSRSSPVVPPSTAPAIPPPQPQKYENGANQTDTREDSNYTQPKQADQQPKESSSLPAKLMTLFISIVATEVLLWLLVLAPLIGFVILVLLIFIPIILIWRKQTDLLLPYGLVLGVYIAYGVFRLAVSSASPDLNISSELGSYVKIGGVDALFIMPFITFLIAGSVYIALRFTPKPVRTAISLVARSVAIFLLFFSFSFSSSIVNHAEQTAQQKSDIKNTAQAQIIRDKTTLDPQLQIYQPSLPSGYSLDSSSGSNEQLSQAQDYTYNSYVLSYKSSSGQNPSSVTISGSPLHGSQQALDACRDGYAQAASSLCRIVLTTKKGVTVAGLRSPDYIKSFGYDPKTITDQQIKTIPPKTFYVVMGNELIQISAGDETTVDNSVTPAFIESVIDGLQPMNNSQRQAFVNQYVKPQAHKYLPAPITNDSQNTKINAAVAAGSSIYVALLLWALQRVFEKAGRPTWAAYVPLYNVWVFARIAGMSVGWLTVPFLLLLLLVFGTWTFILTFVAFLGPIPLYILGIGAIVVFFVMSFRMARRFGGGVSAALLGPLTLIPPFIGIFILGFSSIQYENPHKWDLIQRKPDIN